MPEQSEKIIELVLTANEWKVVAKELRAHYDANINSIGPESTLGHSIRHIDKSVLCDGGNGEVGIRARHSSWAYVSDVLFNRGCGLGHKIVVALSTKVFAKAE